MKLTQRLDPAESSGQPLPAAGDAARGGAGGLEAHLEQVQKITDSTLGFMSLEERLSELLERIRSLLAADTAAILLLDEDRNVLVARAARGLEEEVRHGVQVPLARGFAGRVAAQGRPIVIEDLSRADVVNPLLRRKGIRSMLGVPLHVEGRVIGVMHVGTLVQRKFDDSDVTLLQLAADKAAMAIDVARLTEQRAVTQIMQRTLLPDALPNVPGLRFSAKYLPAESSVRLGGDWYDVFQLPDSRLAFVIGDVVGRGVLAASVMSEIRTALRAYLFEGHQLSRVMSLLNELLVSMGRNRSATAAILELDLEADELQAVSAGHPPALVVSPSGEPSFLEQPEGLPLGLRSSVSYSSRRWGFPPGSALVLYTDGLVERRGEPIDAGLERLADVAAGEADANGMILADSIYGALVDEAALDDDVALLVVESIPLGDEIELTLEAEPGVLAGLRRTVERWLQSQGLREDERFNVTVAVSEAAGNAIEHAYGGRAATFSVSCERDSNGVRIAVRDSGRWRESRPVGRGRGLAIMRALVDSVDIRREAGGTTVTLSKHTNSEDR